MLQLESLPATVSGLLAVFRGCFTAPTFRTFAALLTGLIAQPARHTVCGMLVGAGLGGVWPHQRAHRFFSRAVWSLEQVSLVLLRLVVDTLVPAGQDLEVVVDDTLFKRSGGKVHAARWQHDGSASGPTRRQLGRGNGWVVAAVNVRVPFLDRVLAIPVAFALWGEQPPTRRKRNKAGTAKAGTVTKPVKKATKGAAGRQDDGPTKQVLACYLITLIANAYPDRRVHVVADSWYAGMAGAPGAARGATQARGVPANVTITSRPRRNATFHAIHTPEPGALGRPKHKGDKLGTATDIAATATLTATTVTRYAQTATVWAADIRCLWYGVYRSQAIRLILVCDTHTDDDRAQPYAILTTDLHATTAEIIARYANRWGIEVVFYDAKNITGVGEAHNRTPDAVRRTVPFGFVAQAITIIWYAQHGHTTDIVARRRTASPWYRTKNNPSYHDMIITLRRELIRARLSTASAGRLTQPEIDALADAA
jgi:DDE superfamily endonuclease